MLNSPFVTDLKAIRNGWLLINAAHLPEQISLSMLSYFSLLTPYFNTFLSFWRLISFIIFILCFLFHNYIFSMWGNAGIPDQTVVLAFLLHGRLCDVFAAVTCKIAGKPALFRTAVICFNFISKRQLFCKEHIYYFDCCWYSQFNKYLYLNYTDQKWQIILLLERLNFYGFF